MLNTLTTESSVILLLDSLSLSLSLLLDSLLMILFSTTAKCELGDDFKVVDMIALNAYIAILHADGITHQTNVKLDQLCSDSLFVPLIFSAVLPRAQMREIKKHLRFDDKE